MNTKSYLPSIMVCLLFWGASLKVCAQTPNLQSVTDAGSRTTNEYNHFDASGQQYLFIDTAYKFTNDYYHPVFTLSYHGDPNINVTTPTGSPAPANEEADHVWDMGINIKNNSSLLDTSHGSIGMGMESLYWGGLSAVIPAQECYLWQNFKGATGLTNRFLMYAGLEDGSNSSLQLNSNHTYLNGNGFVNIGNVDGSNTYAQFTPSSTALFGTDGLSVPNSGITAAGSIATVKNTQTQFGIYATGNGPSSTVEVVAKTTSTSSFAKVTAVSTNSISHAQISAINDLGHYNENFISGSATLSSPPDITGSVSNAANGHFIYTSSNAPIYLAANNAAPSATSYDIKITPSHNVLIKGSDTISGNLVVDGTTTIVGTTPSASASDSLLGKNASGQIVAVAPLHNGWGILYNHNTGNLAVDSNGIYLQGGNSFGNAAVIGTNDNNPVVIRTNGHTSDSIAADGTSYIYTTSSIVVADSLLGKNASGQIVSVAPLHSGWGVLYSHDAGYIAVDSNRVYIQGGNSFGDAAIIGTNDYNPVVIKTNGQARDSIAADGTSYIYTIPSVSTSDSLLGKNAQGQMVSIAPPAPDTTAMTAIAILQQQVTDLQSQMLQLQANCSIACNALTQSHLLGNAPNPFTSSTDITYYLADDTSAAYIIITSIPGALIKQYNITGSTNGSVTFDADQWPAAMYMYSLMVDGKLIDTKKMVLIR